MQALFRLASIGVTLAFGALAPVAAAELVGHGGAVRSLSASRDGGLLLSGSFDTSLILWRPAEERPLRRLLGHAGAVHAVALAPETQLALSGGEDGLLLAWSVEEGAPRWRAELGAKVLALAIAPEGGSAAVGTADGRVRVFGLADGTVRAETDLGGARPTALLFAEQGTVLWVGTHEGALWAIDPRDGTGSERLPTSGFAVTELLELADGLLVTGGIDGVLRLRHPTDLRLLGELPGHEAPITALALHPDGTRLASGDIKGRIIVWSLPERRPERVLEPHRGPVWDLAFTGPPATLWSAGNDSIVRRWREGDPPPRPAESSPAGPAAARRSPTAESEDRGERLFRACVACHTVTADGGNRAGPTLFRLFGRPAGAVPGYPYSEALATSGIVWTEETIEKLFALGPETFTPGSKMPLQRLPDARDRAALIDYLKRVTMPAEVERGTGG